MIQSSIFNTRFYALKSFLIIVLVLGGILTPFFIVKADGVPFTDNFNSYILGNLNGQGDWIVYGTGTVNVVDTNCVEGKCIKSNATQLIPRKIGTTITGTGNWVIYFYSPINGFFGYFLQDSAESGVWNIIQSGSDLVLQGRNGWEGVFTSYVIKSNPAIDLWYSITCQWENLGNNLGKARCRYNDESWTDWLSPLSQNLDLKTIEIYLDADEQVDYISGTEFIPPPAGIEPIITATDPIECDWNQAVDWIFDFKGKIEIPTENPNAYTKFILRLYNRQAMEMGLNFTDIELTEFPDLKAGEMWEWDLENLELTPFENGYSLTYWLEGYNLETLKPFRWALMPKDICGSDTILSNQTEFTVGLISTESVEMIYEDCEALTGFEKIMCEFTNWVKSIFAPSKEQLDALNQDLDQIKTKFPFTYISVFSNFVENVKNGIDENKGISFKVFGVEGTVDFSFWEKTVSVGGVIQSFSTIFKGFITLIILIGFVGGWLIPFIQRIL